LKPIDPPKVKTRIIYDTEIVEKIVWAMPVVRCKNNDYPTRIGGLLPNELAILYANMYFDYEDCTTAYWKATEWIKDRNKKSFNNQK